MKVKQLHLILFILSASLFLSCEKEDDAKEKKQTEVEITDNYVYELPVIFHVLYSDRSDNTQYVSAERLKKILDNVNELYQGNIYGKSENINVRFVLAQKDANGRQLSTPGIEYVHWQEDYPIDPYKFMQDNTGKYKPYIWDPNSYVNIMLYHFSNRGATETTLGISHMPYTVKGENRLVGLVEINQSHISLNNLNYAYCLSINSRYINNESSRYTTDKNKESYVLSTLDVNTTLAHELGHYLGAFHTFTERDSKAVDECGDTDYCKDTPSYNKVEYDNFLRYYLSNLPSSYNIDLKRLLQRSNCEGNTFESNNIMDYSVSMGYAFTADQKERMRNVLYYSPLIPGAKKNRTRSAVVANSSYNDAPLDLPIRIAE